MPHSLPALAAVLTAPLLGLAVHAASTHAASRPAAGAAAVLPNNLCASCHGDGRVAPTRRGALDARDLVAARTYLLDAPRG
jgi:mono/diheme cytochrome c family protein